MIRRLSPHALAHYGTDWCRRCWWLSQNHQIKPPSMPFPEVTRVADEGMKAAFAGTRLDWLGINGTVRQDKKIWVLSKPYDVPGGQLEIGGFPDALVDMDDGTVAVVDFKMTTPMPYPATRYEPHLNAYQYALENPVEGDPLTVSALWLICWAPKQMIVSDDTTHPQPFMGSICAVNVKQMPGSTVKLMETHGELLFGPLPQASEVCDLCGYMSRVAAKVRQLRGEVAA